MKLSDLSGDSTVDAVEYRNGEARIWFTDGETDEDYIISVRTKVFYSEASTETGSVSVRVDQIALPIDEKSQRFILPAEFMAQMAAAKNFQNLLVGTHSGDFRKILRIMGYKTLFACPIRDEDDVSVVAVNH